MYIVIFKAELDVVDAEYTAMATRLRSRAFDQYGCLDFTSVCEKGQELAISYWPTLEAIHAWKNDELHQLA
ncbi:MAG: antibiotic biosynthesis monooxygenase family protein, partial [Pontibacterium sp.]